MQGKWTVGLGAVCALWCGLAAGAQALPDGTGKAEFVHNCTACHRADMVTKARKTPEDWKKNVAEMAARGTDGSPEDLEKVVVYLSTHYALEKGAGSAAVAPQAALSAAEMDSVTGLIADNGCLICHRIEKQGGYTGPSLNGVGARKTPEEIRAAIVHPHATLDAKNDLAKITTADGKTIVARMLSQDQRTVKIVDVSGEVVTYQKAELRQFTVVDTNPMPSYEKRIAAEDLGSVVRYLGSLPALDEGGQK